MQGTQPGQLATLGLSAMRTNAADSQSTSKKRELFPTFSELITALNRSITPSSVS